MSQVSSPTIRSASQYSPGLGRYARSPLAILALGLLVCRFLTSQALAEPPATAEQQSPPADPPAAAAPVKDVADAPQPAPLSPEELDKLGGDWVRLLHDDKGKLLGMQTAVIRYVSQQPAKPTGPPLAPIEVDLIGAIHIGDADYYADLNRRFKKYDVLLYELVAPDGTVVPRGQKASNRHPLGAVQNGMKNMLALEHQLEQIDYTQPNFVHADMSPDEFEQAMEDRGEGFLQMYFHMLGQSMAQQSEMAAKGESFDMEVISALFAKDRPRKLKIALAKQLADVENVLVSFGGEKGSVLIAERNKEALKVLQEQLKAGKLRAGVFYGAGHLADMDRRLRQDFGLRPAEITWLTAWNLAPPQ